MKPDIDKRRGCTENKVKICTCGCEHEHPKTEPCKFCEVCEDYCESQKPYCCGDVPKPNRPAYPIPPGWQDGDQPKVPPFAAGISGEEKFKAFDKAVFEILRSSGNPKGPKMGKRKDEYLPYLAIRAKVGDHGNRPLHGVFWESPDIFITPDLAAEDAPDQPPNLGGIAKAGAPNTLWAHVWNLGRSPAYNVRVEFYWCNPNLGINGHSANLIGFKHVDLGDRNSTKAHTIVKCPETWVPTFVNDGHECLVVRVFDPLLDSLPSTQWDVRKDRHIGQRNIAVINAASPAHLELLVRTGCNAPAGEGVIHVEKVKLGEVDWLSLLKGKKNHQYEEPAAIETVSGIMQPGNITKVAYKTSFKNVQPEALKSLLKQQLKYERTCDEKESLFYMHVTNLKPAECVVYRIIQTVDGKMTGGYTVIAKKD